MLMWLAACAGLTLCPWSSVAAPSGVDRAVLGEAPVATMPGAPVNVRVSEGLFPPGTPALTHTHGMGWVYVVQGPHVLAMQGHTETFQPGAAAWTPAGVAHTHDWDHALTHRFWFIGTATNQPATVPPGFRLFRVTEPLRGLEPGPYMVRLVRLTVSAGAATPVVKVLQPEVLVGVSGMAAVLTATGAQTLTREQVLLLQSGSAYLVRNGAAEPAVLLVQSLVPAN